MTELIFLLLFLFLAFMAAFAVFHYAKRHLKTPWLMNFFGALCVWFSLFCLGGAYIARRVPWEIEDPYVTALKYFVLALVVYAGAYLLQKGIARKGGPDTSAEQ